MKTLFEILPPENTESKNCTLIGELTGEGFSYALKNEAENLFLGAGIFEFDKNCQPSEFSLALQIFFHQHELLAGDFKKIKIIYSLTDSVLIPFTLYNSRQNKEVLNLIHGDVNHDAKIITDIINAKDLYNAYRLPASVYDVLENRFPFFKGTHQYTAILQQPSPEEDTLSVIFYSQKMVISLYQNGQYQLINCYPYRVAEDVSFTLLNIVKQFDAKNIRVVLNGLIEENSTLYREIYKYFATISFAGLSSNFNYTASFADYPSQYFSHILSFDSCE